MSAVSNFATFVPGTKTPGSKHREILPFPESLLALWERQYREMQSELAHANRVATMGQLTASIAHEIKQPIATARNNARAALNFLDKSPPDVAEVREALTCIVGDTDRTSDVVDRIGSLIKKASPRKEVVDLNAAILEVTALTRSEAVKTGVAVRDTGHGLRPESLPRLFEPFYTTKPDGMGMGLSICRSIIEAHGGRLWATRCEPRGALFQFTVQAV